MTHSADSPRPARLALVITELQVGGAERSLVELAARLDRRRFDPVVYSLSPRPSQGQQALVDQLQSAAIPVVFLDARSAWQAWPVLRRLAHRLAAQGAELVQTFLFHANVLGTLAARRAGVRHIVSGIRVADPSRWRQIGERYCGRHVTRVVCVSSAVADFVRRRHGVPVEKVCTIPNGIDLSRFPAPPLDLNQLGVAPGRRALAVVGRLHRQKGLDWLIRALPPLLRTFPDVDLVVVGHGPDRAALESLARERGVRSRVHFSGWRDDVPEILAGSQLLLLPSRWEGMPNVVLEAMASGLPVVATRAEGVEELLGSEPSGQIVDFGDSDALVASVAAVLRDPQRGREMGSANRQRAAAYFSLDRMAARYQDLYARLLAGGSAD
jgi:glycosyltransferase involved in cell wall biosynthesis